MFEVCSSMIGAPWLCWAIQITALLLIGLFLWRIIKRRGNDALAPPRQLQPAPEPVRQRPNGPFDR